MCRLTGTTQLAQFSVNLFVHAWTWFGGCYHFSTSHSIRKTPLPRVFVGPRVGTGAMAVHCNSTAMLLQIKHMQNEWCPRDTPPDMLPGASYRWGKDIVSWLCQQSEDSLGLIRRPSANNTSSPKSGKDALGCVNIFRTAAKTRGTCFCEWYWVKTLNQATPWLSKISMPPPHPADNGGKQI